MEGSIDGAVEMHGIIPRTFKEIFNCIEESEYSRQYLVRASYLEIYNETIRDLLSKDPKNKLEIKEHKEYGIYVKGLNTFVVKDLDQITNVLKVNYITFLFKYC